MQLATDLVNTLDAAGGEERLGSVAELEAFLSGIEWDHPEWKVREQDLHEVRALRSRLRAVFEADDVAAASEELNSILVDSAAMPRISVHDGASPHLHFDSREATPARWLGVIAAMGLGVLICDHGLNRLGVCASSTCDDVFVDSSRNQSRRNCSETCTNRENVAAHRRRSKKGSAPGS